jgi:hypothetical protein
VHGDYGSVRVVVELLPAVDLRIGRHGVDIWWPQLDDGLLSAGIFKVPLGQRVRGVGCLG